MSSHLGSGTSYTAQNGINRDPGCSPRPNNGWYTRSGQARSNPDEDVRSLRIIRNNNLISPISPSNPNDGYTAQDELTVFYDGYIYKPGTYRGSTYGWDNNDESCSYQAPPGGDNNNAFDLVRYSPNITAFISVSPTTISEGDSVTLTYYTATSPGYATPVSSSLYWSRSTSSTNKTWGVSTYAFIPATDQTEFFVKITDGDGNTVIDSCAITIIGPPTLEISTDAPLGGNRNRILLGNSHNLTFTGTALGGQNLNYLQLRYPWPDNTTIRTYSATQSTTYTKTEELSPTETTTYQVYVEDAGGASTSKLKTVYVDDPPAPTPKVFLNNLQQDVTINITESVVVRYYLSGFLNIYKNSMYITVADGNGSTTTNYDADDLALGLIYEQTLTPTQTTTVTVGGTGLGSYGTILDATPVTRTITVISDPPLPYISANPTTIINGGSSTLTYGATGTNITSMTLSYLETSLDYTDGAERTLSVNPTTTTTYSCNASNSAGSGTAVTATVTVLQPPTGSLSVDQSTTCPGVARTFTYTVTGDFSSAEVLNPNGTQAVVINSAQTNTFTSSVPGTYTLNVYAGYGMGAYDIVDTASVTQLETITADLVGSGVTVYSGSNVTLAWYVQGSGVTVSLDNNIGIVNQNGFTTVTPTSTTTYTLTAVGTCNTVTDTFTVTVLPAPPGSANPLLTANPTTIIEGQSTTLQWSAVDRSNSVYTLTDVNNPGSSSPPAGFSVSPTDDKTYTYTVDTTYTSISYTNISTLIGWVSPGVPCPSGHWKCGSNLPHPNGLLADKCCQVVSTTTTTTNTESDSVSITVYEIPELTLTVGPTSTMIIGEQRTLSWSVSGDGDRIVWTQPGGGNNPTNTNLTSSEIVAPTVTTTYSAYPTGLGGIGTTKSVTITVYQLPTLSVTWPALVDYGNQALIEYTTEYANTSVILTATYYFLDGTTTTGTPVSLSNPSSAEFGIGVTEVTDEYTTEIPWSSRGAMTIVYTMTATGNGGLVSDTHTLVANVDITPVNIDIQDSDDLLADQEPVITPGSDQLTDQYLIDDIDVDVEIKSDYPIQVQVNNNGTWENVREL